MPRQDVSRYLVRLANNNSKLRSLEHTNLMSERLLIRSTGSRP